MSNYHDTIMRELEQQGFTPQELLELDKLVENRHEQETGTCSDSV